MTAQVPKATKTASNALDRAAGLRNVPVVMVGAWTLFGEFKAVPSWRKDRKIRETP